MKAVIFDLDGTLVDTLDDLTDSMNHALTALGQPRLSSSVMRRLIGDGIHVFLTVICPEEA